MRKDIQMNKNVQHKKKCWYSFPCERLEIKVKLEPK